MDQLDRMQAVRPRARSRLKLRSREGGDEGRLVDAAVDLIARHKGEARRAAAERFEVQLARLQEEILTLSQPGKEQEAAGAAPRIRAACSDLALRATHTAMALYKGAAMFADHPAQRLAREAMFLLVWSSPDAVLDATVEILSGAPGETSGRG
jgi:alkylation response protein AidB-like acyl-CoA dehydrogenase